MYTYNSESAQETESAQECPNFTLRIYPQPRIHGKIRFLLKLDLQLKVTSPKGMISYYEEQTLDHTDMINTLRI